MPEPRRHHIVPQHHLRRFATVAGQVWVLHRADCSKGFVTSVENVAVERDFYAVDTEQGASQRLETKLIGPIESDAAPALDRMLGGDFPPSTEDRCVVSAFIALQWLRGWDSREQIRIANEHWARLLMMNTTRASVGRYCREVEGRVVTEDEVDRHIAFASDPTRYRIKIHRNELLQPMLRMLPGIINLVYARKWQILESQRATFLTSDAPVTLWTHPSQRTFGVGFGTADEIAFAIGRRHALLLTHDAANGEGHRLVPDEAVWALNCRTAASGRRWVIHHPDDSPPLVSGLRPPEPKIRISPEPFRIVPAGK